MNYTGKKVNLKEIREIDKGKIPRNFKRWGVLELKKNAILFLWEIFILHSAQVTVPNALVAGQFLLDLF